MNVKHFVVSIMLLITSTLQAAIINTKHNLSTSGVGTIKATGEQEVCVFCHIPHSIQTGTALWNRSMPASTYTMYNSDYLRRMSYPTPAALGNTVGSPGTLSRQCLSCHDGTVAVGSVYLVRGTLLGSTQIAMNGVNPDGTMASSAAGYIGSDLRGHHPVGIEYNHLITKNFGSGTRPIELLATPDAAIKLYTYSGKQYVECSSCHDPHTENGKFLRYSAGANHGANVYGTCTSCHDKTSWGTSAHATVTNAYTDATVNTAYGAGTTVSSLGCINCHKTHNGEGKPYLLRKVEESTCFQGAGSGTTSTVPCHGTGGAKDIQTSLARFYSHPTEDPAKVGQHSNLDVLYGVGIASDGGTGITWAANKHAECTDCHNPHKTKAGSHIDPPDGINPMFPAAPSNLVSKSGPLTGATGVEPTWPSSWVQPTTFTTLESATKEYQICLKCHSQWALGTSATPVSSHTIEKTGEAATDQAWEFNPKNKSAHPVVMSHNEMKTYGGNAAKHPEVEGRYADSLTSANLKTPWSNNPGNNTMYCSDCHGADEQTSDPRGPHGSSYKYMLKGRGNYWPYKPNGALWDIDSTTVDNPDLFCQNCHRTEAVGVHVFKADRSRFSNMVCVNCHIGIPHGSKVSRLMAYAAMPHPYNFNGNAKMKGFRALGAYNYVTTQRGKGNHWTNDTTTCSCHGSAVGGTYDAYP